MSSAPPHKGPSIDKVRASREGHAYHEAWAARVALELLVPSTMLKAIALEGFSAEDAPGMSAEATEIADLVRYRGAVNLESASAVEVVQFKYSIAQAAVPMRATNVTSTLVKFAKVDNDFIGRASRAKVEAVVSYELVTNRPFHPSLISAIDGLQRDLLLEGDAAAQAEVIKSATGLIGGALTSFLSRFSLTGNGQHILEVRASVHRTLADWGGASDTLTQMRLANLRDLVKDKAGAAGQYNNLIDRIAVLAVLGVAHESELFPTPDSFPAIGLAIKRPIADDIASQVSQGGAPLLIHSAGGIGKTVLMQALAKRFDARNAVVLFDCFGAGRWRDPADGRHLPQRALPHIANLLAGRGLCDILISSSSVADLVRAFRERLLQAVRALRNIDSSASVVLLLDGIDHSALQASETRSESFAHLVLQSLSVSPIEGVTLIASCRTERLDLARGRADCRKVGVPPFSTDETARLVLAREPGATPAELAALHNRSGRNPRVLDALLRRGRPYDSLAPTGESASSGDVLEELLERQIADARREAVARGVSEAEIDALLAGLALLPPPVPPTELAIAQALPVAAIESFASDLSPLLDRTPHGLIFRDEPTETLIRRLFRNDELSRQAVIERLEARQIDSTYAARALPQVLTSLGRTDDLIKLAFDSRLPEAATSRVAQRAIRLSRLAAALVSCASEKRTDDLTRLLLEATRVAGGHERSDRYLQEHPDLVAISGDPEAMRRLFECRTGWPGACHAALAVAHAFANEAGEARRNARRAFGWLEWRSKLPERYEPRERARTDEQDRFGPAYVEILAGNMARVALWTNQWREDYAYKLFSRIVDLLERHGAVSVQVRARRDRIIRHASRCRLKSRALAAALLQHADLTPDEEQRLIKRLARESAAAGPVPNDWTQPWREADLTDALVGAAMKAVRLGLRTEARTILDRIGLGRPRLDQFDIYWSHSPGVERWILSIAIRAALEQRPPNLMDVAPYEIASAIRARKHYATPEAFEAAVQALLQDPPATRSGRRARPKSGFDYRQREVANRTLIHRVRPLLPYASTIADLIRGGNAEEILAATHSRLAADVAATKNYPYRNGRRYIARTGFDLLLTAADALGVLSREMAQHLIEWLIQSPSKQTDMWIWVISLLSRRAETHNAALNLAQHTCSMIQLDTDIDARITAHGGLARAVWRVSQAEAKVYFRQGLDITDAIGSDDYERATGLVEFASHYEGPPLPADVVHNFVRICELNIPGDAEKFGWVNFGHALSRLSGANALALVARLADREKGDLSWSLPPLLTALVERNHLDTEIAAALIGLDEPNETWGWSLADFAKSVLPKLQPPQKDKVTDFLLREIDRQYLASPPRETLDQLSALAEFHLLPGSASLARLAQLRAEAEKLREAPPTASSKPPSVISDDSNELAENTEIASVDFGNSAAIDAALFKEQNDKFERRSGKFLVRLRERIRKVDDQLRFLRAVSEAKVPSLSDKLWALADEVSTWRKQSAAIDDEVPKLAIDLGVRHALELIGPKWESSYALRQLIQFSGRPGSELVPSIIAALRDRAIEVSGATWLEFACIMARNANAEAIRSALERFVSLSAPDLPDDLGDGPWRTDLALDGDPAHAVAGLLWFRLGCPDASGRWRAAHAVRRLGNLGRTDVLDVLVRHLNAPDAGPFQDRKLPFFRLHAKLWLLIALARLAGDQPEAVLPFKLVFETVAFEQTYPHVLMQHFAALALKSLAAQLDDIEKEKLLSLVATVNSSRFPRAKASPRSRQGFYGTSFKDQPESNNPFHFDYDFSKYEINGLAGVFGCDHSEVAGACTTWIRRWSSEVKSMWECPRTFGHSDTELEHWGGAKQPAHDAWGGQMAWHALMLTAGDLLRSTPVAADSYKDEPWSDWLSGEALSRTDGLWLADGTDFFPSELRIPIASHGPKDDMPSNPLELASLAGIQRELSLGDDFIIDGLWKSEDGIDVIIRSVLTDSAMAESVAFAVATAEPFDQWLPRDDDHFRWRTVHSETGPFRPFTTTARHTEGRLDGHDPYGSSTALNRARPTDAVIKMLRLKAGDPFGRTWRDKKGASVFRAEAWGATIGEGRYAEDKRGTRLMCRVDRLRAFLSSSGAHLVLLVKVQKLLKDDTRATSHRVGRRRHVPFRTATLIMTLCPVQGIRLVRRIPAAVRSAVANLPKEEQRDLEARFKAIHRSRSQRRGTER